jgi:hypothetical protein
VIGGYTHGEIALTVFIFLLIYAAGFMTRAGRVVGRWIGGGKPENDTKR